MSDLTRLRKAVIESINTASEQNKKIEAISEKQYELLRNLTLQLELINKLIDEESDSI